MAPATAFSTSKMSSAVETFRMLTEVSSQRV
jgi:hypothetical protein